MGRLALGSHRTTPNEAVQGDMGWSSFAAREATAKLSFEMRAWTLGETNWVYRVRRCLLFTARSKRWTKRMRALSEKYGVPLPALCNLKDTTITRAKVQPLPETGSRHAQLQALQAALRHVHIERLQVNHGVPNCDQPASPGPSLYLDSEAPTSRDLCSSQRPTRAICGTIRDQGQLVPHLADHFVSGIDVLQLDKAHARKFGSSIDHSAFGYKTSKDFLRSNCGILCATCSSI
ncbi:hypothetical protein HPB48_009308 [Haemaphysalis longicornis]|uniref:Uncharacterized protein n=1 Tax=Haemaphysalis longicornis TaxID=44386 RepID=A0A9J6FJ64_HAELO|nr:hypothetical protein HPB48_009308 [Haemaphysalis longicornis]